MSEPKKLSTIRILQILERYSDEAHPMTQDDIMSKLSLQYGIDLERKAVGKSISMLQEMFEKDSQKKDVPFVIELATDRRRGSYFRRRLFDDSEVRLLIDSVLASKHISQKYSSDLIAKLCSLSNEHFRTCVKHVCSVGDWGKTDNKQLFLNIEEIDRAIEKGKQITFDYYKYGNNKKLCKRSSWAVSPYQLILHNQRYYLIAHNERWDNVGYYRVDKIKDVQLSDADAKPLRTLVGYENGIDYKKFASSLPYMFSDELENVTFLADADALDQIIDWFGEGVKVTDVGDNKVKVEVTASPKAMEYWAMQYLNYVEVIAPKTLRDTIKDNIAKAQTKYN